MNCEEVLRSAYGILDDDQFVSHCIERKQIVSVAYQKREEFLPGCPESGQLVLEPFEQANRGVMRPEVACCSSQRGEFCPLKNRACP